MNSMTTGIVASSDAEKRYCHSIILNDEKVVIPTVIGLSSALEIKTVDTVYSFQAFINTNIKAVTIPGAAIGASTFVNAETVPQPSISEASSISGEIEMNVPRSSHIANA